MPTVNKTSKARPWAAPKRDPHTWGHTNKNRDVYDNPRWKKLRAIVKEDEPLCRYCLAKGLAVDTKDIDHILSINNGGKAYDRDNLQGLCRPCHLDKSREERKAAMAQGRRGRVSP